jgi:hypothetical protein
MPSEGGSRAFWDPARGVWVLRGVSAGTQVEASLYLRVPHSAGMNPRGTRPLVVQIGNSLKKRPKSVTFLSLLIAGPCSHRGEFRNHQQYCAPIRALISLLFLNPSPVRPAPTLSRRHSCCRVRDDERQRTDGKDWKEQGKQGGSINRFLFSRKVTWIWLPSLNSKWPAPLKPFVFLYLALSHAFSCSCISHSALSSSFSCT